MDPSGQQNALLNPKGHNAALPRTQSSVQMSRPMPNGFGSQPPVAYQFSSASDSNLHAMHGQGLPYHNQNPAFLSQQQAQTNGMGSFLERMNNVQDRSDVPQPKRRKTVAEGDIPDPNAPNGGFHFGSGGILGQAVKDEQQKNPAQPRTGRVETVDLTSADADEDVVMLQKPAEPTKDEEVCLGMLEGAMINCHKVPAPRPQMQAIFGEGYWPQVKVVLRRLQDEPTTRIHVYDYTRDVFGFVDVKTSNGLAALLDSPLQIRTDCRIPPRKKQQDETIGQPISRQYKFELMVYSPRKWARQIGNHLAKRGLKLVSPTRVFPGTKVFNPHSKEAALQQTPRPAQPAEANYHHAASTVRTAEEIRSEVMGVFDSLTKSDDLPQSEPADCVQTPLLKHQKQALWFMLHREQGDDSPGANNKGIINSSWQRKRSMNGQELFYNVITGQTQREPPPPTRGGILADMMGLGKTLSILSLVTSTRDEAAKYETLQPVQPETQEKKQSNHQRSFELPKAQPAPLTRLSHNGKGTLLICPLSTIANWEEQMKQHIKPGTLSYHIYHGQNRLRDANLLSKFDLVVTTYGSVASECSSRHSKKKGPFPLEEIGWFRIVLDEAHMIREQNTLQFKAVCRLQANRRWAVTGTPVQNRLDDLAALLSFLRLKPFDEKSKFIQHIVTPFKNADPEIVPKLRVLVDTITLRRQKDKIDLPKRTDLIVRLNFTQEEKRIYDMFAQNAQDRVQVLTTGNGHDKILGGKSYIHILQSILRLRLICAHGKELLSPDDLSLLQGMTADDAIDLDSDDDDQKPALEEHKAYELLDLMRETNSDNCIKCNRKLGAKDDNDTETEGKDDTLGYMTPCFHAYCPRCVDSFRDEVAGVDRHRNAYGHCPECQLHVKFMVVQLRAGRADAEHESRPHGKVTVKAEGGSVKAPDNYGGPHTKTRALLNDLLAHKRMSQEKPDEPTYKSVVFSGWTSHLDLIQLALQQNGIEFTRLDGKMSRTARGKALDEFRDNPSIQVILVSITAGGVGLNLTTANSVYVMEPQFNPAAEAQAIDRVHRLGQKREVRTVRYIMNGSFEEKMLELQDKKMKLASLSMDGRDKDNMKVMDRTEAARNRLLEIRSLFK
ncbi:SNF2 family N-terminal domain-containing protein [Coniochaeta sp. 2T2.1]|nr:SNF2 family N-terminal domain-containing protein [Coniochaeta sp. 2T2.1]